MMPMGNLESRRIDSGEHSEPFDLEQKIKELFTGYTFEIVWYYARPLNPECEAVEILLTTRSGDKYMSNFTTLQFIEKMLKDYKTTGDCASGTYFSMPGLVILEKITPETVKKTIDSLIEESDIDDYFEKIHNYKE